MHLQVFSDEADQEYEDDFEVFKDSICQIMDITAFHAHILHLLTVLIACTYLFFLHALTIIF